jgi:hypothetical protein
MANEWARSPPTVSGVPCGSGEKKAEMLSMPHTILGMGLERWPPRIASVFPVV